MNSFYGKIKNANKDMSKFSKIIILIIFIYLSSDYILNNHFKLGTLIKIPLFMIAIIFHECGHALAAYLSGDDTAKKLGRLTLNPIKHLDPIGFLLPLFLIFMGSSFVIGWAKPVPVNYSKFRNGRVGEFFVSIAGVFTNLLLAFLGAFLLRYAPLFMSNSMLKISHEYITYFVMINVILAVFNFLPIPPLDGSKIIASFSNSTIRNKIFYLEKYGLFILIALSYSGILGKLIEPGFRFIIQLLNQFIVM